VPGVDAFIIGPYDLSCSMGIPGQFDLPEFKQIIEKIIDIGNVAGMASGLHVVEPDAKKLNEAVISGHKFIAYSVDIRMLDASARNGVNEIRKKQ
jgi:2-dehydro-3-deoxyglucarate aldolase